MSSKDRKRRSCAYALVATRDDMLRALAPFAAAVKSMKDTSADGPYHVEVRIAKPFGGSFVERVRITQLTTNTAS